MDMHRIGCEGRLRLIDVLVALVFVIFVLMLLAKFVFSKKVEDFITGEPQWRYTKVETISPNLFLYPLMKPGDKQLGEHNRKVIELLEVRLVDERDYISTSLAGGKVIYASFEVYAKILKNNIAQIVDMDLVPGARFVFYSGSYKYFGTIVSVR
jgi:hypothetical protein